MSETSTFYLTLNLRIIEEIQFLKKRSVGKIFEMKEIYNLTEILRIRNLKAKQYTFRQNICRRYFKDPEIIFHLL